MEESTVLGHVKVFLFHQTDIGDVRNQIQVLVSHSAPSHVIDYNYTIIESAEAVGMLEHIRMKTMEDPISFGKKHGREENSVIFSNCHVQFIYLEGYINQK